MAESTRRSRWFGIGLAVAVLGVAVLALGVVEIHVSRGREAKAQSIAPVSVLESVEKAEADPDLARQVTVIGIAATPNDKAVDAKLIKIKTQLNQLLPDHGFRLLNAQSKGIKVPHSVTCKLSNDYTAVVSLVKSLDENGKTELQCELFQNKTRQFSRLVKTPLNQLFFCQRALPDGSQLLIGVGAR